MSGSGQSRRFDDVRAMSAFPQIPTELRTSRHFRFAPISEVSGSPQKSKSSGTSVENCSHKPDESGKEVQPAVSRVRWRITLANILIVDDDIAVQAVMRLLLERDGHEVVVASDGLKGLKIFESGTFDLLVVDIFMPGMDGLETMRLVHQQRPDIPIIVISGRPIPPDSSAGPDFLTMAVKLGAISSLQKPFKAPALRTLVNRCLQIAKDRSGWPTKWVGDVAVDE
jgi:CheY-like chemotaxis protein